MTNETKDVALSGGTYEIIRKRLAEHAGDLKNRLEKLNTDRKAVFGSIEPMLLATERITTDNNCTPRDIVSIGNTLIFAYNVQFGLKSTTELSDVFAIYRLNDLKLEAQDLSLLQIDEFQSAFDNLYKYYKHTIFTRFFVNGPHLYMVFQIGKAVTDIKTFKWLITPEGGIKYLDNRSDHEYRYPPQHEFEWKRTNRDYFRKGKHPHISIEDRLFIETIGGDLTVKIEDNTESGEGIYSELVDDKEQTLDDAEILYASVGPMILLKIRPYRETAYRYLIYNEKIKEVVRIDEIGDACILLPDGQGIIYSNGYYLLSGEFKRFDYAAKDMLFERRIPSPNGEDTMYIFHHRETGGFVLLSYNIIDQTVRTPVLCHGYSLFFQGELLYFRAEDEPQKHHKIQIWQTPFVSPDYTPPIEQDSLLYKIGNKDLVRCMAECHSLILLSSRSDTYEKIYDDIYNGAVSVLDSYFWIENPEVHNLAESLTAIRDSASSAIDEFEKVRRIRKTTAERLHEVQTRVVELLNSIKPDLLDTTQAFISALAQLRNARGEVIGLNELRYIDTPVVEELEKQIVEKSDLLSEGCIDFLVRPDALDSYYSKTNELAQQIQRLSKVSDSQPIEESIAVIAHELETMVEVVGNLNIEDATKSAQIIEGCSGIFTQLNTSRAQLKTKRKELQSVEAIAEFSAQVKLLDQNVVNYLDIANTPEKCDDFSNKLLVRIEELEARFVDFDQYVIALAEKRTEVQAALEARKLTLVEEKNKKAASLQTAADRILKGVLNRAESMKAVEDIHSYFASDLMIDKIRSIIKQLMELGDSVKADELQTRLKSIRENAVRQLKDRQELFLEGQNVIRFGKHAFSVNTQKPDLTMLMHNSQMCYHITGTNFFEQVTDQSFLDTQDLWQQEFVSENNDVYRAEYLAFSLLHQVESQLLTSIIDHPEKIAPELLTTVQQFMSPRFDEGYIKGVHDIDATSILHNYLSLRQKCGLLRYNSTSRALARIFWHAIIPKDYRQRMESIFTGISSIRKSFPEANTFSVVKNELRTSITQFIEKTTISDSTYINDAAEYLFEELSLDGRFIISQEAAHLHDEFLRVLREKHLLDEYEHSQALITNEPIAQFRLIVSWLQAFLHHTPPGVDARYLYETASILLTNTFERSKIVFAKTSIDITDLIGSHPRIANGAMLFELPDFSRRLSQYSESVVPRYQYFVERKRALARHFREEIRLSEYQPRVLTSFVRNKLIDDVYLPLVGDNLAKQMGTVGPNKRTDFMGLLLLISPPGYGKTTLMEYIANRLGLIFMKINGPSLGHQVTSLDPENAPNAAAREEVNKLNLALEMGDNVLIYLDDIQHCNPEFLQKFISLCDGQRRIEGIWRGRSRTYDLRGRKVAVVMAGNPYTESGDKFRIPDMLANRADTYNLGDIIGDNREVFELSFIENSLTSNPILNHLNSQTRKDIHLLIDLAKGRPNEGIDFDGNYSAAEINDIVSVLQKMLRIQKVILNVNKQYIASAAQEDAYRTEPAFKLQGSYRNMNKLAEKVIPIMNDDELKTLITSHYEGEAQTLTTGAEANLLKFRELTGWLDETQRTRWDDIKKKFQRNQKLRGQDESDKMTHALVHLADMSEGLATITEKLAPLGSLSAGLDQAGRSLAESLAATRKLGSQETTTAPPPPPVINIPAQPPPVINIPAQEPPIINIPPAPAPEFNWPERFQADLSDATLEKLTQALGNLRIISSPPELQDSLTAVPGEEKARGEFLAPGKMRQCLEENGFHVEEFPNHVFRIRRDKEAPIEMKIRNDRLTIRTAVLGGQLLRHPSFAARILELNAEIQPVSFALENGPNGDPQLVLLESRDGRDLTRLELIEVVRSIEAAARRARTLMAEVQQTKPPKQS